MSNSSFKYFDGAKPILVFGRDGQLGRALQIFLKNLKVSTVFLGRADCDLSDGMAIKKILKYYQPQVIINAAAYTAVDKAESERELAFAINTNAPAEMANYITNVNRGVLIHYSTDYVFADSKECAYLECDAAGPIDKLSIYGQSKLAGEQLIQNIFNQAHNSKYEDNLENIDDCLSKYYILRASWIYGDGDNFIRTILSLLGKQKQIKVVSDQVGAPTSAEWLAKVSFQIAVSRVESGIYHAVPNGEISWHGLALYVAETVVSYGGGIKVGPESILPVSAIDYPLIAPRPYNSRLNNLKLKKSLFEKFITTQYPHWHEQVKAYVKEYVSISSKR